MGLPELRNRAKYTDDIIRRIVAYTTDLTYFGRNSSTGSWAKTMAVLAENGDRLYAAILRRTTIKAARDAFLTSLAREHGAIRNEVGARARVFTVLVPETANVTAIVGAAPFTITVDDGSVFLVGDSIRIRSADGATSDVQTITGKPAVNDIVVALLPGVAVYQADLAAGDNVAVLFRATVPAETLINSNSGTQVETLTSVITGDANPILTGEGTALSLADKVWSEATTTGDDTNIEALDLTELDVAIRGVASVYNPEAGAGGDDVEADPDLRLRAVEGPAIASQEALAWIESTAKNGEADVLRILKTTSNLVATIPVSFLNRNGGTFTANQLTALESYIADRMRSGFTVVSSNITLTSIEVEALITLSPGFTLEQVWRDAASRLANYLDYRKWTFGQDVDEAQLLAIVRLTEGIESLDTSTFLPAADVAVADTSLPTLIRLSLQNIGVAAPFPTINATLAQSF